MDMFDGIITVKVKVEDFTKPGDGALSIEHENIKSAIDIVECINWLPNMREPVVTRRSNGFFTFKWEYASSGEGYMEIGQAHCSFYVRPNEGEILFMTGSTVDMKIIEHLLYCLDKILRCMTWKDSTPYPGNMHNCY